jgi:hypothetical protein
MQNHTHMCMNCYDFLVSKLIQDYINLNDNFNDNFNNELRDYYATNVINYLKMNNINYKQLKYILNKLQHFINNKYLKIYLDNKSRFLLSIQKVDNNFLNKNQNKKLRKRLNRLKLSHIEKQIINETPQ